MMTARRIVLTGIQRAVVLVLLVAGLVVGSCLPSWASFTDSTAVGTTISTATVAPPGNFSARTSCRGSNATVTLSWTLSPSARVSAYRVRAHFGGGAYQDQPTVGPTTNSWSGTTDVFYVNNYTMTFTVWTETAYGWSAETAHTPRIVC
jgi:hypothetical protein